LKAGDTPLAPCIQGERACADLAANLVGEASSEFGDGFAPGLPVAAIPSLIGTPQLTRFPLKPGAGAYDQMTHQDNYVLDQSDFTDHVTVMNDVTPISKPVEHLSPIGKGKNRRMQTKASPASPNEYVTLSNLTRPRFLDGVQQKANQYIHDPGDSIDMEVFLTLKGCYNLGNTMALKRVTYGKYEINNRPVTVYWERCRSATGGSSKQLYVHEDEVDGTGVVADIPLRQYLQSAANVTLGIPPRANAVHFTPTKPRESLPTSPQGSSPGSPMPILHRETSPLPIYVRGFTQLDTADMAGNVLSFRETTPTVSVQVPVHLPPK